MTTSASAPDPGASITPATDRRIARRVAGLVATLPLVKFVLSGQTDITANEAYLWHFATYPNSHLFFGIGYDNQSATLLRLLITLRF